MARTRALPILFRVALTDAVLAVMLPANALEMGPLAAPLPSVEIAPLPVVRSQSQQIEDFANGLVRGLANVHRVQGLALIAVDSDRVMLRKVDGVAAQDTKAPVNIDSAFPVGRLGDILTGISLLQLIDQGKLSRDADIGTLLDDSAWGGTVVSEVLARSTASNAAVAERLVVSVSGQSVEAYVQTHILIPLDMRHSRYEAGQFHSSASDIGRLAMALLNNGELSGVRILAPETVQNMFAPGDAEQRAAASERSSSDFLFGRRKRGEVLSFQYDARVAVGGEATDVRLVLVPGSRRGYFLAVNGQTDSSFWRGIDNALLDQLTRDGDEGAAGSVSAAAPSMLDASAVEGIYRPAVIEDGNVFLATANRPVTVAARDDGGLLLSGGIDDVLLPRAGFWSSPETQLTAFLFETDFAIGDTYYRRVRIYERPWVFAWIGAIVSAAGVLLVAQPNLLARIAPRRVRYGARAGLGLVGAGYALLLIAAVLGRLALAA